jgi:glycosyltransferase involved in cell wall biosynthesis
MRIAYVFRHAPAYIRSTKEINSLVSAGHEVTFVGWDLDPKNSKPHSLHPQVRLEVMKLQGEWGKPRPADWLRWWAHLGRQLLGNRFDAVHAVDEPAALLVAPFKRWAFRWLVLDVYDSVIKRKASTRLRRWILAAIRSFANLVADRIIETSEELKSTLGRFQRKAVVLFNSPNDPAAAIEGVFPELDGPVRVAATGAIHSQSMALECLVRALDGCPDGSVEVCCTGWLMDDYARKFVLHPAVHYQWIENQDDYYRMLASCDCVFNMRVDAGNSLYRSLVFPNKVFDALAVGRPVFVAAENWVSEWVVRNQTGWVCSVNDPDTLRKQLLDARKHRNQLPEFARRCRELFLRDYAWEIMETRLAELYRRLPSR